MHLDVVELTKDLIAIPSVSQDTNLEISDYLDRLLSQAGFEVERLEYLDDHGIRKISLVAKIGRGKGGLGLFSHSDTVPGGDGGDWDPFTPSVADGRLIGRGSCDMKGPLAATIVAAMSLNAAELQRPLFVVITADEEAGYGGANQVAAASALLKPGWPDVGVVAEPTCLRPVYAHKGGIRVAVTAHGRAAHTSTGQGISANFLIAPFMAEMAALDRLFKKDTRFMNRVFDPPSNGFNMVIDDGNCRSNVTAAKTTCTLSLRTMPNDHRDEALAMIMASAGKYNLDVSWHSVEPHFVSPDAPIVQAALRASGAAEPETVPFGTEAAVYTDYLPVVILGPGDIAQAHTTGEWIDTAELQRSVPVYRQMIETFCINAGP